jgi:hypothetical protein
MRLEIAYKYGRNKSSQVNAERLVNMYAEQTSGLSPITLHSVPGLTLWDTLGTGPIRGMKAHNERLYVVSGNTLYEATETVVTNRGTITGSGHVIMATNGIELCIVTNNKTYIFETSLKEITDPDFPAASSVAFLDGYFLFVERDTGRFFISGIYNGDSFDALDFATAESNPDKLVRVFTDHREVLLFGSQTMEPWANTGNADFPFEAISGAITEKGCGSKYSVARIDNAVFFVDDDGVVRRLGDGYAPIRISTHEVEQAIKDVYSTSTAMVFVFEGHEFYCLNTSVGTYLYDAATQLWHERKSLNLNFWRGCCQEKIFGLNLIGDYQNGNVYRLDAGVYAENDTDMVAEVVFPVIHNEGSRFRVHKIELDAERGAGVLGSPTKVRLDISNDGSTWRTIGYSTLGAVGDTSASAEWRRIGQHKRLHVRFLISDPAPRAIYGAYAEIEADG